MESGGMPLVSLRGVSKSYGHVQALKDVDLEVREGEVFGFIGPNGAGKTTAIKCMIGLLSDFEGELTLGGLRMPAERARAHALLGYLPQHVAFQEWRTVEQVLVTFGTLSGLSGEELSARMEWALDYLGIAGVRGKRVTELSGGTHQKVGMAQAVLHRPRLLVLDEPMAGLDPASRYDFKEVIRELNREGTTVFFSSHILSDVQDVATRMGILSDGTLRWRGTLEELKDHFEMSHDWEVELSLDNGGWRELASMEGLLSLVQVSPGVLLASIDRDAEADAVAHRLLEGIVASGCHVRSFKPSSPSLEQLYMRYVGGGGRP